MPCQHVALPGGGAAIVCGGARQRCACGRPATLFCDWRIAGKKNGTCDRPLCRWCTFSPKDGKDLCQEHHRAFQKWQADRAAKAPA